MVGVIFIQMQEISFATISLLQSLTNLQKDLDKDLQSSHCSYKILKDFKISLHVGRMIDKCLTLHVLPGAPRSDSGLRQQDQDQPVHTDSHVPVQHHLLPGRHVLLLHCS